MGVVVGGHTQVSNVHAWEGVGGWQHFSSDRMTRRELTTMYINGLLSWFSENWFVLSGVLREPTVVVIFANPRHRVHCVVVARKISL